jgi:hypothetical protein
MPLKIADLSYGRQRRPLPFSHFPFYLGNLDAALIGEARESIRLPTMV